MVNESRARKREAREGLFFIIIIINIFFFFKKTTSLSIFPAVRMSSESITEEQMREIQRLLSFPPGRPASPFAVLGIPDDQICTITTAEVSKLYRRLSLLLHPDKCLHPQTSEAFAVVQKSYGMLSQEPVLVQLQRAEERRRQQGQRPEAEGSRKREREEVPLGHRTCLATSGLSTTAQKAQEIQRILSCSSNAYFDILDLDPEADFGKREAGKEEESGSSPTEVFVRKLYRRMAQALHPDKCPLPDAAAAFQRVEKAYQELQELKKFVRHKAAYQQQKRKASLLQRSRAMAERPTTHVPKSFEERHEALRKEQQLEAARLAEMAEERKRRKEEEAREQAKLAAQLERQRREWKNLML